ncbi:MAG: extracellular solute-binding protein, partial [Aigarchaeota archaeon]|nr:extracellular solute-binding protein [Aigarchaeota archaeon]
MSQEKEAEKMGRRTFLKYAAGAAAGVVIGAVAVYGATELTRPGPTTVTAPGTTVVTTAPGTTVVTTAPPTPGTVSERAIAGAKALVDSGAVPKGTVLKLLHVAGSRAQLAPFINDWKNKTGIGVELVTVGVEGDVFTKLMAEATAKTGIYDLGTVFSTWIGDLVESGIAKDLDGYYKKYDPIGPPDVAPIEP